MHTLRELLVAALEEQNNEIIVTALGRENLASYIKRCEDGRPLGEAVLVVVRMAQQLQNVPSGKSAAQELMDLACAMTG